jgi:hypothetical protein
VATLQSLLLRPGTGGLGIGDDKEATLNVSLPLSDFRDYCLLLRKAKAIAMDFQVDFATKKILSFGLTSGATPLT